MHTEVMQFSPPLFIYIHTFSFNNCSTFYCNKVDVSHVADSDAACSVQCIQ